MTARARRRSATAAIRPPPGARSAASPASSKPSSPFEREVSVIVARGARRRHRMLRRHRERASRPYSENLARAGRAVRRRGAARRAGSPRPSRTTCGLCRRAGGRDVRAAATAASSSTRSRRGCTIPGTGPSTAPRSRSSSSISARSPAGRSAGRSATAAVEMINLIGSEVEEYRHWLAVPGAAVHLYGKTAVRPGRKMGHVTRVLPD